jgi:uncharacterized protein YfaS (alpha-2-macroglobulin family)
MSVKINHGNVKTFFQFTRKGALCMPLFRFRKHELLIGITFLLCVCLFCSKKPKSVVGGAPGEIALSPDQLPPPLPEVQEQQQTDIIQPLSISLSSCEGLNCNLTFYFSLSMVPEESLTVAKHPNIVFSPEIPGTFSWQSPTTLIFSPNEGGMSWGQYVEVSIDSAVPLAGQEYALSQPWSSSFNVPYFQMAGKVASWPIYKDKPHFIAFLNWNSGKIGAGPLLMLYDQPFQEDFLKNKISAFSEEGEPVEIKSFRPASVDKSLDSNLTTAYIYAIQLPKLPQQDATVSFQFPSWETPDTIETVQRELTVNRTFSIIRTGDPNQNQEEAEESDDDVESEDQEQPTNTTENSPQETIVPLSYEWVIVFSNNFSFNTFKNVFKVNPAPVSMTFDGFSDYDYSSDVYRPGAVVSFTLNPGTTYTVSLPSSFKDVLGNSLGEGFESTFRSVDLPPKLDLPSENILVEMNDSTIPLRVRNITGCNVRIHSFKKPVDFAVALMSGNWRSMEEYGIKNDIDTLRFSYSSLKPNTEETVIIPLGSHKGLLAIEAYAEGTGSDASGRIIDAVLVQRTNTAVSIKTLDNRLFVWATRLNDGKPLQNANVKLVQGKKTLATAPTDSMGVTILQAKDISSEYGLKNPIAVVVENNEGTSVAPFLDDKLSQPWQFGLNGTTQGMQHLYTSVFTDRGVYRPGDSVYIKIIANIPKAAQDRVVQLLVNDSRGQQVIKQNKQLDTFNSADCAFLLNEQAPVGAYSINLNYQEKTSTASFRVEEYRVPTFKVSVTSQNESWNAGEDVFGTIKANYLHGGTLDGREVRWEVLRQQHNFLPRGFEKYTFTIGSAVIPAGSIESGSKRLDGQGQTVVKFHPDHSPASGPMKYSIEAVVTDIDRQAYSGRLTRVVHPADFYVGVKPPSKEICRAGQLIDVPLIIMGTDEKPVKGVKIQAVLERLDYHTAVRETGEGGADMLNRQVTVPVDYKEFTSNTTPVTYTLKTPSAGVFRLRVWAKDSQQRTVQSGFTITASGNSTTSWPRFDQDIIEVVSDKSEYLPDDVAKLVVQSPFNNASGLVTIEYNGNIDYFPFQIKNNTPSIDIPIKESYAPNVYVSVMLTRGRVHYDKDASGFETGAPGFKIGYKNLTVVPRNQKLEVNVNPSRSIAQPGQNIQISFNINNYLKKPAESRIACIIVDEAILGLTGYKTPDPLSTLYAERTLGVRTGTSILDLPHSRRARFEEVFPSGDDDQSAAAEEYSEALRKLFKSTAYWNPGIPVGPDGKASVSFDLPDNLTTYRIMAVAFDAEGRVGSADRQVTIKKPLMIQAVVPRFVYPDDKLRIEALVYNGTDKSGKVTVNCTCKGLFLDSNKATQCGELKSDGSISLPFLVDVTGRKKATVTFKASMGDINDAVEVTLPILESGTKRTDVISLTPNENGEMGVKVPAERIPGSTSLEIVMSATALSELKDAVQYLMQYPNGCIEQTTSTAYPLVVLKDLLPIIGVEVDMADLKKFSEAGVRRILSFQTPSGGLSYWPGSSEPHAFATAFGLTALIAAKDRGYDVPTKALDAMADFLEQSLRQGTISGEMPHGGMADGDTRALFVMTLGRLGRPQQAYINSLWNNRKELTPFGLSFLAIAIKELPGDHSLLEPVLAEVKNAAQQNNNEAWYDGNRKGGWSFDSPLRTHAAAVLASAISGDGLTTKLLSGLLKRRTYGMWGNTQENVFGIMGVHAASVNSIEGQKGPEMVLKVNTKTIPESAMEKNSPQVNRIKLAEADLFLKDNTECIQRIQFQSAPGKMVFLTARLQYEAPLNEENRKARANGYSIKRVYQTLDGTSLEGKPIPLGSLVRVRLSITASVENHYVAIDDKLPAGLEPLNSSLETTERVSQGKLTQIAQRSLSVLSYSEMRDSRVAFFVDEMLPGEYEFSYVARATTPGTFLRPAARVEAMYEPDKCGTSIIDNVIVEQKK